MKNEHVRIRRTPLRSRVHSPTQLAQVCTPAAGARHPRVPLHHLHNTWYMVINPFNTFQSISVIKNVGPDSIRPQLETLTATFSGIGVGKGGRVRGVEKKTTAGRMVSLHRSRSSGVDNSLCTWYDAGWCFGRLLSCTSPRPNPTPNL